MSHRAIYALLAVAIGMLVVAGALALNLGGQSEPAALTSAPAAAVPDESAVSQPVAVDTAVAPEQQEPRASAAAQIAQPVRVKVPSIGIDAHLVSLGLDAAGALEAPKSFTAAGWWSGGFRPGERGPAVIAGHVDSKSGPAVFFRLRELRRGDAIVVTRRDGSRIRFVVQRSGSYGKDHFPTKAVYGPTRRPTLRLITCSGTFDRSTGHYVDNTVVYAVAAV